jgi:hypothetical protein
VMRDGGGVQMAGENTARRAELLTAQMAAQLGAVDHPLAPIFDALGLKVRPGIMVLDTLTNEVVEVVSGGIENISSEAGGA